MSGTTVTSSGWYEENARLSSVPAHLRSQDEHLDVIYINEKVAMEGWHTFEVGKTAFNDEALRQAGERPVVLLLTQELTQRVLVQARWSFTT